MSTQPEERAPCRLYLITPPMIDDLDGFADAFKAALDGGDAACLQIRLKDADGGPPDEGQVLRAAEKLQPLAKARDVALLINDSPALARKSGADGVHLGQSDMAFEEARAMLGPEANIGVTCHNSIDLAFRAGEAGADYVAFGAFFSTMTKQAPTRAVPEILTRWREMTVLPSVAIGGITPQNGAALVEAGADFLAVSAAIWQAPEGPGAAMAAFQQLLAQSAA